MKSSEFWRRLWMNKAEQPSSIGAGQEVKAMQVNVTHSHLTVYIPGRGRPNPSLSFDATDCAKLSHSDQ